MSKCLNPPKDENGTWTVDSNIAKLSCNEGYAIPDGESSTMTCDSNAMWNFDGAFPQCECINCPLPLDSPCRMSTNLISYYMTELNGINVIIKILIIWYYFKKKWKNMSIITGLIILLLIHTCVHILIIIASLPQLCDSSNINWNEGKYFNFKVCHWKSKLYYSLPFWLIDILIPGIISIYLLRK